MIVGLFEKLVVLETTGEEMEKWFVERTNYHIGLVQNAAMSVVDAYPEYEKVLEQVEEHDASKFEEPEQAPYIVLSWKKKQENEGKTFEITKKQQEAINEATLHHILNNSHHPEFYLEDKTEVEINKNDRDKSDKCVDASRMLDLDIVEMVCDWQAMSEELQTNTAREWFDKQKNVRWCFSSAQEALIDKILKVFE